MTFVLFYAWPLAMFWTYETTSGLVLPDSFLGGGSAPRLRYLQLCGILVSPDYRNCSYLPLTSSIFTFVISLIPGTSHPRRWSLAYPHRTTASKNFGLISNLLDLAPTQKNAFRPHRYALSFSLSLVSGSKGPANTWRTSWPASKPLDSATWGITSFHSLDFDAPQIVQFISRTRRLKTSDEARVVFQDSAVRVRFPSQHVLLSFSFTHVF